MRHEALQDRAGVRDLRRCVVRFPAEIPAGTTMGEIVTNVDFAATFLDLLRS